MSYIMRKPLCQVQMLFAAIILSHLSAHMVNRLLRENRKTIPKFLSGKKLFKNVTLQILSPRFYPSKLTDKFFPVGVMLNFLCFLYCLMQ